MNKILTITPWGPVVPGKRTVFVSSWQHLESFMFKNHEQKNTEKNTAVCKFFKDFRPEVTKFVVSFDSADRKKMQTSWGFQDVQGEVGRDHQRIQIYGKFEGFHF